MRSVALGFCTCNDTLTIASAPWIPVTAMLSTLTLGAASRAPRLAHAASARPAIANVTIASPWRRRTDNQSDIVNSGRFFLTHMGNALVSDHHDARHIRQ